MEDSQEAKLLPCHHMFHVPCIQTWLNKVFLKRIIQFICHCHSSLEPAHEKPVPVVGRGRCVEQAEVQNCCSHVVLIAKVWHVIHSLREIYSILCLRENDTVDLACCNSAIHQPILIAFGRVVAEWVSYQIIIYFSVSPDSALPGETWTPEIAFLLNRCILLYQQIRKHVLLRYLCNSVKCCLLSNTPWMLFSSLISTA